MTRDTIKPGPGWRHMGGAVYEHTTGVRIHGGGLMAVMPDGRTVVGAALSMSRTVWTYIEANGHNRRRGLMAWALSEYRKGAANGH